MISRLNLRQWLYFSLVGLRGQNLSAQYQKITREYQNGIPAGTTRRGLIQLLEHCKHSVPYYSRIICELGDSYFDDPLSYLKNFPILTKDIIRDRFEDLKSSDLPRRKWFYNTSGGSTGEPARFIQDWNFSDRSGAIKLLYSKLLGREIGDPEVSLWGSVRDIAEGSEGWRVQLINKITNSTFINTFRMTAASMRACLATLNTQRPRLIVGYADALYQLARFAENEHVPVVPQVAIISTAGTLDSFMREKIEQVFQCKAYNRYGSREVGDIACELPGREGLWVAPWGNFVEIVDENGLRAPDGEPGEILVTSLSNYAMPLIRYKIGDQGILRARPGENQEDQVIEAVLGRVDEYFPTKDGVYIKGGYFRTILYFYDWIAQYQIVQKDYSCVLYRFVRRGSHSPQSDLDEIAAKTRQAMGQNCEVRFEFPQEILPSASGKFRFTISEVPAALRQPEGIGESFG